MAIELCKWFFASWVWQWMVARETLEGWGGARGSGCVIGRVGQPFRWVVWMWRSHLSWHWSWMWWSWSGVWWSWSGVRWSRWTTAVHRIAVVTIAVWVAIEPWSVWLSIQNKKHTCRKQTNKQTLWQFILFYMSLIFRLYIRSGL